MVRPASMSAVTIPLSEWLRGLASFGAPGVVLPGQRVGYFGEVRV